MLKLLDRCLSLKLTPFNIEITKNHLKQSQNIGRRNQGEIMRRIFKIDTKQQDLTQKRGYKHALKRAHQPYLIWNILKAFGRIVYYLIRSLF